MNPLTKGSRSDLEAGNLTHASTTADLSGMNATIGVTSGKWYWEVYINDSGSGYFYTGIGSGYEGGGHYYQGYSELNGMANNAIRLRDNGSIDDQSASDDPDRWGSISISTTNISTMDNTDIVMVALDYDNKKLWFGKNGTFFNSGNPATGTNAQATWDGTRISDGSHPIFPVTESYHNNKQIHNFGQDSTFDSNKSTGSAAAADGNGFGDFYYTPPSGYLALCSANVTTSTNIDPAETDDDIPTKQFAAITYTGNGGSQSINVGFRPDFVWFKNRGTANSHLLFDSSRGATVNLYSERSDVESTAYSSVFGGFTSTGFDLSTADAGMNNSTNNYIAWCWRANGGTTASNSSGTATSTVQANTKAGFSICLTDNYTSGTGVTIGHGLGAKPAFYIHKPTGDNSSGGASQAFNWHVYHHSLGATKALFLNLVNRDATAIGYWNNTEPTSTVLSLGNTLAGNGQSLVYAWSEIEGFSKFGQYTANTADDGPAVYTGFRPRLVWIKMIVSGDHWGVWDSARGTENPIDNILTWSTGNAESSNDYYRVDFLSNGFKIRSGNAQVNHESYDPYIWGAWADVPFKYGNAF